MYGIIPSGLAHFQGNFWPGGWFSGSGDLAAPTGGRLYSTSMATMILEVYYRHMPLYREQSLGEDFPE